MSTFDAWVDSLPLTLADRPHVVYIAWLNDIPLYVGMTHDLEQRLRSHRSSPTSNWAASYTHIEFTEVANRAIATRLERQVILDLQPANNRWKPSPYLRELTAEELAEGDRMAARLAFGGAA